MARYTGPSWKLSRRLGISLSGTGKELEKRPYAPGQHGPNQRRKLSEYGLQLQEKQKLRHMYGLNERQFHNTFLKAGKMQGKHGENFMVLLESRLDNLVYRLGLARTRRQARQLVNHGHILVDGKRVDIPSYRVEPGQTIGVREKSRNLDVIKEAIETTTFVPDYLSFDADKLEGTYSRLPERSELPAEINESLIVEFYSR
ncbi:MULTISPECIES: 30S ribosomal protein S4 [Heyndrickxia]|jgi:small subunit ribosomal protein S4|uniref:Small ribosomal subunit protein uS4 n=4 Tax=Heyndrickxia TaxID=2837504 RepID=A0A0C5C1U9_HEYCO|nr:MULTISPECIES: 30S ribosomal protein S4 [Heyndrickxia]AEH54059.1 ribosomal protein S4 [Heyndrickxia coagulans 2-6]AEP01664.1 ribosomal protein S4 [Heyndrickxia coagulans 36D1]AJH79468.1 ribosomal protein S4 [Heyndrickxia coagulans DSM 1 = ATCC 7050]AJO22233.1 30S ribosomal protein S4 [Heyndrickxia coagulans]AKN56231.1 SSU ribosomal protein S4p (S9e) [Heyndrickxia coagulans]